MVYLSRKQEALMAELESCAAALQERARKIGACENKSVASHAKRKREVWKTRNNSGQVATALNTKTLRKTSIDSDQSSGNVELLLQAARQAAEAMISSPAKRAKKTIAHPKKTIASRCKPKALGSGVVPSPKSTRDCYCQVWNKCSNRKRPACKFGKNCPLNNKSFGLSRDLSLSELDSQRKTLEEARSVISYSPESVFLRRLKTRSQINLNAKDDISSGKRFTCSPVIKEKEHFQNESQEDSSQSLTDSPKECMHQIPLSLKKKRQMTPSKTSANVLHSRKENIKSPKFNGSKTTGSKKTSSKSKKSRGSVPREIASECNCRRNEVPGYDIVGGLVDNSKLNKRLDRPGSEKNDLVDKVSEFRRTHWFDCHAAHDHPNDLASSKTSLLGRMTAPDGHECVHRYFLNDRLFPTPLYADADNQSRCMKCHLPEGAVTNGPLQASTKASRPRGIIEINLPKRIVCKPLDATPSVAGFRVSGSTEHPTKVKRTSRPCPLLHPRAGRNVSLRPPVPSNSLALRFQKGIA